MGIRGYHLSRIDEIEDELGIDKRVWFGSFKAEVVSQVDSNTSLLRKLKGGYFNAYLNFWNTRNSFYKMKILINILEILTDKLDKIDDEKVLKAVQWLILEYIILFSICVLEASSELYSLPSHQRKSIFLTKLISGKLSVGEKEELVNTTYKFFTEYSRSVMRRRIPLRRDDLMFAPAYYEDLYNLISNIIKNSITSRFVPRYLDLFVYEYFMQNKEIDWEELHLLSLVPERFRLIALKESRDIIKFLFPKTIPEFIKERYFVE